MNICLNYNLYVSFSKGDREGLCAFFILLFLWVETLLRVWVHDSYWSHRGVACSPSKPRVIAVGPRMERWTPKFLPYVHGHQTGNGRSFHTPSDSEPRRSRDEKRNFGWGLKMFGELSRLRREFVVEPHRGPDRLLISRDLRGRFRLT